MSENFNRSYDSWSDTPQEWKNDDREESILDPKWNSSLSNTNELSEEEEVTETLQRTRKIIRGGRKNRDSSDSETRIQSRVKCQLQPDQQKEADNRLLSFWQLIGGESKTTRNINRELVATSEETDKAPEETDQVPIIITPAHPNERKLNDVQVIEVDLKTTEDTDSDQEVCAIEPPKSSIKQKKQKLQKQQTEESLDNLSKLFDKSLLAELTSEDTWMDRLRRVIERGDKQGVELLGPIRIHCGRRWRCRTIAFW